jgi:phospholipid-binding lipoprotein MlaA
MAAAAGAWALAAAAHGQIAGPPPPAHPAATSSDAFAVEDPFEKMNRRFYAIHQGIDHALLRPLALGYSHATSGGLRKGLHNVVTLLGEPVVFGNDVLQLRPKRAAITLGRMVIDATIGLLGVFDPATRMGLPHHDNGFGTTLGRWGVKPGPYLFIPLVGPTNFRDVIGTAVDFYSDPIGRIHYHDRGDVLVGTTVVGGLDERANAESDLEQIESMGTDSYATLRSLYTQKREADIHGGNAVSINNLPDFDDPGASTPAAPAEPPATPPPAATDPGVASPSAAEVPAADPASGPDAEAFLTSPPLGASPPAGPPIEL